MPTTKTTPGAKTAATRIWVVYLNNQVGIQSDGVQTVKWTDSVTYGDNIPGWREKLRLGQNVTTSLDGVRTTVSVETGRLDEYRKYNKNGDPSTTIVSWSIDGCLSLSIQPYSGNPSSIDSALAINRALSSFVQKAIRVNTAVQGGVVLGQLAQTLHGIRHPAQGLRKLVDSWYHAAKSLRSSSRAKFLPLHRAHEALAELWLEHSYHWKPLLHDIDDGCRALAEINTKQAIFGERITATNEVRLPVSESIGLSGSGGLGWYTREVIESSCIAVFRGAVRVNPRTGILMNSELLGFNPSSFLPTVWELIPYSFLIDYFTNISEIISGWSFNTSNLSWSNMTVKKAYVTTRTAFVKPDIWKGDNFHLSYSFSAPKVIISKSTVSRGPYNGTFVPSLTFEIPGLGSGRWLNIAALVAARGSDRSFKYD